MSPKLARLSGHEVVTILGKFGFSVVPQRGSHAKLRGTGFQVAPISRWSG
jgi:predicted RNA binding protein YcfA (HicA-like mRNA interferase family)